MRKVYESIQRNSNENCLSDRSLYIRISSCTDLCISFRKRNTRDRGRLELAISFWGNSGNLPIIQVRNTAHDTGQYLCDSGSNHSGGAGCIIYICFYGKILSEKIYPFLQSAINLLAGVPSVVYGFFGLIVIVPMIHRISGRDGSTMLAASVLLAIMILPTIIGVTESALRSVPDSYYEGSLALGATHERSVFFTIVPAAKSGIVAGIVLGIGRAVGETMAVIMVAGNQARMPAGLFRGVRTLTANIVMEMGYAADLHREALIATGVVLFVFIMLINLAVSLLNRRTYSGSES